jgi:hypothetical protein
MFPTIIQNVSTKQASTCTHFHNVERRRLVKDFPHLAELPGDQVAKDGVDIGTGIKIAPGPDLFPGRIVITQLRVVKDPVHELGKRDPAAFADEASNDVR